MPRKKHDTSGTASNHRAMKSGSHGHQRKGRRRASRGQAPALSSGSPVEQAIAAVEHANHLTAIFTGRSVRPSTTS